MSQKKETISFLIGPSKNAQDFSLNYEHLFIERMSIPFVKFLIYDDKYAIRFLKSRKFRNVVVYSLDPNFEENEGKYQVIKGFSTNADRKATMILHSTQQCKID